jgi:hypothetical protein
VVGRPPADLPDTPTGDGPAKNCHRAAPDAAVPTRRPFGADPGLTRDDIVALSVRFFSIAANAKTRSTSTRSATRR